MTATIMFLHGAWVTPRRWDPFVGFFEAQGYTCLAPAWPGKDHPVAELRADSAALAGLGAEPRVPSVWPDRFRTEQMPSMVRQSPCKGMAQR